MAQSIEEELNELRAEIARVAKERKSERVLAARDAAIDAAAETDAAFAARAKAAGYISPDEMDGFYQQLDELRALAAELSRPSIPQPPRGRVPTFEPPSRVKPVRRAAETYGSLRDRIYAAVVESNGLTKPQLQRMFYPGKKNRTALASHLGMLEAEGRIVIEKGAFDPETNRPCDMVRPSKAQRVATRGRH